MLSKLRNFFSLRRRRERRAIESMFGTYVSPEVIARMIEGEDVQMGGAPKRERVHVLVFVYPGWGFSDAALPTLRARLEKMGSIPVEVSHDRLTICLTGERERESGRVRALLESMAKEPEFAGFRIGSSDGWSEGGAGIGKLIRQAMDAAGTA